MSYRINRKNYAQTYGPTKGDRVRLADTELIIEVEKDFTTMEMKLNLEEVRLSEMEWASRK